MQKNKQNAKYKFSFLGDVDILWDYDSSKYTL